MDPRIHDALDGVIDRDELSAEQLSELAVVEARIASIAIPLLSEAAPDVSRQVMTRLPEQRALHTAVTPAGAARRWLDWLWAPRPLTVNVRAAYAVAAAAMLILVPTFVPRSGPDLLPVRTENDAADRSMPQVYVQFRLEASGAHHVAVAGSFTNWKPDHVMRETAPGTWSILIPLAAGIHDYAFVIDGTEWVADPHAFQVADGFGGTSSRIALPSTPAGGRAS
jgi:hypothetical protein